MALHDQNAKQNDSKHQLHNKAINFIKKEQVIEYKNIIISQHEQP